MFRRSHHSSNNAIKIVTHFLVSSRFPGVITTLSPLGRGVSGFMLMLVVEFAALSGQDLESFIGSIMSFIMMAIPVIFAFKILDSIICILKLY